MDRRSVELLEFDFILSELKSLCTGPEGEKCVERQDFLTDREGVDALLEKVTYLKRLIESDRPLPELSLPEIAGALEMVRKEGSSLDGVQLASIARYVVSSTVLYGYVSKGLSESDVSPLARECAAIPDLRDISRFLLSQLDDDGSVKETLPALRSIRGKMQRAWNDISATTAAYLQNQATIWQTNVATQKDGRSVLPLKADHRGSVKGIIREVSSSGATVFIEPYDLVEKNNTYALLQNEYRIAVAKILRECSAIIRQRRDDLILMLEHTAYLDSLLARAKYAANRRCVRAEMKERGFCIKEGRHPMLGRAAVPVAVELEVDQSVLIISGPNAGGKTVALKTIGLFALMNQFGMCIPAGEGSGLQIFSEVFADIGDDQSIEESLSTFSAHMKNIARFADRASAGTLVLLDELGSGTDPEEGSAIAMAVLDRCLEKTATVVATTHQSVLKSYAFSKPGVVNASVSFDADTHRPTYRIVQGLPGESHALEIAENSGMNQEVLARARRYLDEQSTDVAKILREITAQQRLLNERESEYEKKKGDLIERIRETDLRSLRLKQREIELRTQGYMQLTKQIQESRRQFENLVKELREGELTKDKTRSAKRFIEQLQQTADKEREQITEVRQELAPDLSIEPGLTVLVGNSRQRCTVLRKARKGFWIVSTDKLKITVPESDIKAIVHTEADDEKVRIEHTANAGNPVFALDLRGYRLADALDELDRQIDRAILANMQSFEVIHGYGEGVLKDGIHQRLRAHRTVKGFYFAVPEEGGFGKTIVELL
ncbi:MAG: endonuclease MutS2 [Spirochaetales bacterium]|nr:endonuclease MutS2 [Spirochaetales bacterium]